MRSLRCVTLLVFLSGVLVGTARAAHPGPPAADTDRDRIALESTSEYIRGAFAAGDVATIMLYHHPLVNKALAYQKTLVGRPAVAADLELTFRRSHLEFVENKVESLLILKDTAIEQSLFTLRVTPLQQGEPFLYKGRSMTVYVRYPQSPTGWASIREIIQPADK